MDWSLLGAAELPWAAALVLLGGFLAGAINAVVGSGTLISFPILLLLGVPPVTASICSNLGLIPGSVSSVWEYRAALARSRAVLVRILPFTVAGALAGALLLVLMPTSVFDVVVPILIAFALATVVAQPWIQRATRSRLAARGAEGDHAALAASIGAAPLTLVLLIGMYGGYFGAAQGILLLVLLSVVLDGSYGEVNGVKNAVAGAANVTAAIVFLIVAWSRIDWVVVALLAVGAFVGGLVGARGAKRLPPLTYRIVVLVVGAIALVVSVVRLLQQQ